MATVLDLVKHYQHNIEKYSHDEQKVLRYIDKLFHLDVKVQHLQETGVGRTVNALRKEPGDVGKAARALVYKWKQMVAAEESDQEGDHETTTHNGHGSGKESDDSANQLKIKQEPLDKSYNTPRSHHDHKQVNGDHSGSKRMYQSSEEEEPETKKSKHSSSSDKDDHRKKYVEVKEEPYESDSQDSDDSQSEDSDSEMSELSEEDKKPSHKIKTEPTNNHSSPSKHSHSRHDHHKRESSSSKKSHESEKHSKHHSSESRHSSEKTKDKSNSSKDTISREKDSSEKKHRDHKSADKDKKHKEESKSSSKHSSDKHKSSSHKTDSSPEKHKSAEKSTSKSEKSGSSSHKHKSSSEKEIATDKHKSKDSSSKDKSSSCKEKSKEKSSSSKDKSSSHSHKSEKKHLSTSDSSSKSDSKSKSEKTAERSSDKKSSHKSSSSSSSHKSSKSSSQLKQDIPKKKVEIVNEDSNDGIDCGSGASFAEALGMAVPTKSKKKSTPIKDAYSPNNSASIDLSPAAMLAPTAKLAPLPAIEISALPEISPNYKPRPPPKFLPHFSDEDAMSAVISSKNQRTKVYSGNKTIGTVPTLYEMCVQILQEHIDALEYTGGVPYEILKPVVDKATPQQLFMLEHYNPYLIEDTDHLWQKHCEKHFRNKKRQEMETWRDMYMRCQEEQEIKLRSLTENIKLTQEAKKAPIKQTKMAYVDTIVKPPRNIARKQALHGTAHVASASPAARVAALSSAANVLKGGSVRPPPAAPVSSSTFNKPKKAPLMQKALQLLRGRKR